MTPQEAYWQTIEAGRRSSELEDIVLTDPWYSYLYALELIGGRWTEAENVIATSSNAAYCYAFCVIKGKLPEKMHNMMLLYAIENPDDRWVKEYFEYIK